MVSNAKQKLIGLKVDRLELSDDRKSMRLLGEKNGVKAIYIFEVEGECCSNTWIESIVEKSALIGYTILSVEDLKLNEPFNKKPCTCLHDREYNENASEENLNESKYHDSLAFYGFAMFTERGRCVIDFRNDSNGFYGGSIELAGPDITYDDRWQS